MLWALRKRPFVEGITANERNGGDPSFIILFHHSAAWQWVFGRSVRDAGEDSDDGAATVALLALPDTEAAVIRHHILDEADLTAIAQARTPETRLGYALQLCAQHYPGRHLRRGEVLAGFARRGATRYEQLALIKRHHGFRDLTAPVRATLGGWMETEAIGMTDGRLLIGTLISRLRADRIVISGTGVIERMAAGAMHAADQTVITVVDRLLSAAQRDALDLPLADTAHPRQSRLSWLREPPARVGVTGLAEILEKVEFVRATGLRHLALPVSYRPRLGQMAREGVRLTAQAFQQMTPTRRHVGMVATLRELESSLTDAALTMFGQLVGRANLRARKRLEETVAASADQGRERLRRIADVLDALTRSAKGNGNIMTAVSAVAPLAQIEADAALIRRSLRPGRPDVLAELPAEYRPFKQVGHRFLASFVFEGGNATAPLRAALRTLTELGGNWRRPLPDDVPFGHLERRWQRYAVTRSGIDRTYWELATYFALAAGLAFGDIWVATSRLHRSLDDLIAPVAVLPPTPARLPTLPARGADQWLEQYAASLDTALLSTARGSSDGDPKLFAGDRLRFPKDPQADLTEVDAAKQLAMMLRMQTWHMREETLQAALSCLTDAIMPSRWRAGSPKASALRPMDRPSPSADRARPEGRSTPTMDGTRSSRSTRPSPIATPRSTRRSSLGRRGRPCMRSTAFSAMAAASMCRPSTWTAVGCPTSSLP
ncbi:MAG: hypothetical protein RLY86_3495 [Pseudomonadota bacterium]|jgi:hypothetical protein